MPGRGPQRFGHSWIATHYPIPSTFEKNVTYLVDSLREAGRFNVADVNYVIEHHIKVLGEGQNDAFLRACAHVKEHIDGLLGRPSASSVPVPSLEEEKKDPVPPAGQEEEKEPPFVPFCRVPRPHFPSRSASRRSYARPFSSSLPPLTPGEEPSKYTGYTLDDYVQDRVAGYATGQATYETRTFNGVRTGHHRDTESLCALVPQHMGDDAEFVDSALFNVGTDNSNVRLNRRNGLWEPRNSSDFFGALPSEDDCSKKGSSCSGSVHTDSETDQEDAALQAVREGDASFKEKEKKKKFKDATSWKRQEPVPGFDPWDNGTGARAARERMRRAAALRVAATPRKRETKAALKKQLKELRSSSAATVATLSAQVATLANGQLQMMQLLSLQNLQRKAEEARLHALLASLEQRSIAQYRDMSNKVAAHEDEHNSTSAQISEICAEIRDLKHTGNVVLPHAVTKLREKVEENHLGFVAHRENSQNLAALLACGQNPTLAHYAVPATPLSPSITDCGHCGICDAVGASDCTHSGPTVDCDNLHVGEQIICCPAHPELHRFHLSCAVNNAWATLRFTCPMCRALLLPAGIWHNRRPIPPRL